MLKRQLNACSAASSQNTNSVSTLSKQDLGVIHEGACWGGDVESVLCSP
jgi:hypothetical protein